MKGCFYLQRRFAYIGHAIAIELHRSHGMTSFCGLTSVRSGEAYLRAQTDVPLTQLLVEEDLYAGYKDESLDLEYLTNLEHTKGLENVWTYILADRVVRSGQLLRAYPYDHSRYTHEEMLRIVQSCAKAITRFLDEEKPDFVLFSIAGNISSLLLYHLARARGIRTLFIDCARIGTGYFLTDGYESSTYLWETFRQFSKDPTEAQKNKIAQARTWLENYRATPTYYLDSSASRQVVRRLMRPSRFGALTPSRLLRSLRWAIRDIYAYHTDSHRGDYSRISPWWTLWDKMLRSLRVWRGYGDLFEPPVAGEKYAYFALHAEPESYPTVLAPFYADQVWLAKQIARSLPVGWKLYIKDHPMMRGLRTRRYYKELRKIPNVRLITIDHPGLQLAAASGLTFTLTGTAAWEAILLGRPSIIFGTMFYEPLSAVRHCHSIESLPQLVSEHLQSFRDNFDEVAAFVAAVKEESVDVDLVHLWDVKVGADTADNRTLLRPLAARIAHIVERPLTDPAV